jgi:hypothetical protein
LLLVVRHFLLHRLGLLLLDGASRSRGVVHLVCLRSIVKSVGHNRHVIEQHERGHVLPPSADICETN